MLPLLTEEERREAPRDCYVRRDGGGRERGKEKRKTIQSEKLKTREKWGNRNQREKVSSCPHEGQPPNWLVDAGIAGVGKDTKWTEASAKSVTFLGNRALLFTHHHRTPIRAQVARKWRLLGSTTSPRCCREQQRRTSGGASSF